MISKDALKFCDGQRFTKISDLQVLDVRLRDALVMLAVALRNANASSAFSASTWTCDGPVPMPGGPALLSSLRNVRDEFREVQKSR